MSTKKTTRRRKKKNAGSLVPLIVVLVAALVLLGVIFLLPGGQAPWQELPEEPVTTTATETTAGNTTSTATTTAATAATTLATTLAGTKTTVMSADGSRWLDSDGLLQLSAKGRYVQADSYNGKEIPWNLRLVNDWNPLPKGYDEALDIVSAGGRGQRADSRILDSLNAMLEAGKAYGIDVQSGYRMVSKQDDLYWRQVRKQRQTISDELEAQTAANTVVKRPGYSEHHVGLAVDLGGSGNFALEQDFEDTEAFAWLMEHCHEYGFILRFPKNKEAITGVIYEPWHYRYVGVEAATEIMEKGLCLEEYLAQTKQ